jgi:hypothetical protein
MYNKYSRLTEIHRQHLGPHPPAQQEMVAQHLPSLSPVISPYGAPAWDNIAHYTALNSVGVATQPLGSSDWYLDTSSSTHMLRPERSGYPISSGRVIRVIENSGMKTATRY